MPLHRGLISPDPKTVAGVLSGNSLKHPCASINGGLSGKDQIGNALSATDHGGKKLVEDLLVHERQPALEGAGAWGKQRECTVGRLLFTNTRTL